MKSLFKTIWDSPDIVRRDPRYKSSALSIIFDLNTENNKRPEYSLGRFELGSNSLIKQAPPPKTYVSKKLANGKYGVISSGDLNQDETENCKSFQLKCSDPSHTDTSCPKNKCIIGEIEYKEDLELWEFRSSNTFSVAAEPQQQKPLKYFTKEKLKSNPSSYYSVDDLIINKPATKSCRIINSFSIDFRNSIRISVAAAAFIEKCSYREACIESSLLEKADENIRLSIVSHLYSLGEVWREFIFSEIEPDFYTNLSAAQLLSNYLDILDEYRESILIVDSGRYNQSKLLDFDNPHADPIYSRLPDSYKNTDEEIIILDEISDRLKLDNDLEVGTVVTIQNYSEAYKYLPKEIKDPQDILRFGGDPLTKDPFYTPKNINSWISYKEDIKPNIARWINSGVASILSDSKIAADLFYHKTLDPNTCSSDALDWISHLLGFTGEVWNQSWTDKIKRAVLLNAFGWSEDNLVDPDSGYKTPKGEILSDFPFNSENSNWTDGEDNWGRVKWTDEQPLEYIKQTAPYTGLEYYETKEVSKILINKEKWLGLFQTKGNLINLIWWLNVFDIKDSNLNEEIVDNEQTIIYTAPPLRLGTFTLDNNGKKIKSTRTLLNQRITRINNNLDASKINKISSPIVLSPAQVATSVDIDSLENPLLAGITPLQEEIYTVIPLSFKYSRTDEVWDQLSYVVENWMPVYTDIKVQYQYMAADYAAADDVFFDPSTPETEFIDNFDYIDWPRV